MAGRATPYGNPQGEGYAAWLEARFAAPAHPFVFGPWRGSRRSVPAQEVPHDYMAGGNDFLYQPRTGYFIRRQGQTQKFDTFGAAVGLLPAKWSSKGRMLTEFVSESVTDGVPTLLGLATKETVASGLDDGRFSQVYVRDQVNSLNYTLGDEYGSYTYPAPGTVQKYKFVPLWYESGDGGVTRGVDEFMRRFFACGSRKGMQVGNWWYFPNRYGTPMRWRGRFTQAAMAVASTTGIPNGTNAAGLWRTNGGSSTLQTAIDETVADDTDYITQQGLGNIGSSCDIGFANPGAIPTGGTLTLSLRYRRNATGGGAGTCRIAYQLGDGTNTIPEVFTDATTQSTYTTLTRVLSAATLAGWNMATLRVTLRGDETSSNNFWLEVSWVQIQVDSSAAEANRLIPSGPLPPCHAGYLSKGTQTGSAVTINLLPDVDDPYGAATVGPGGWSDQSGGVVNLYAAISDSGNTATYIKCVSGGGACDIGLGDPGFTPDGTNYTVTIRQTASGIGGPTGSLLLYEDVAGVSTLRSGGASAGTIANGWINYSYTLSAAEVNAIVNWTRLYLKFAVTGTAGSTEFVATAYLEIAPASSSLVGGWKGSDRFYFAVAYRFEDGSVWVPTTPRAPNSINANGLNLFTVDSANPNNTYDRVVWHPPVAPYGVKSVMLLRTTKIDSTTQDNLQLNPRDVRIVWEVDNGTLTYDDYFADDAALVLDPEGAFVHFDHIMPPRSRYIFGGDMRVCHGYGGQNPAAIILAPVGRAADYDLNLADDSSSAYAYNASFMRVAIDSAGAGTLELWKTDGTASVSLLTLAFSTYDTLQKLVDRINFTSFAVDGLQWRAQIAPGASPDAACLTALCPHIRAINGMTTTNNSTTISLAAGGLSKVPVGAKVSGTNITAGTYVTEITSDTALKLSAVATGTGTPNLTFAVAMGDTPTAATAGSGYQRVIANSLPGFLYFTATYLNRVPIQKDSVWMTSAIPGATKSAANNFNGRVSCRHSPPLESGIVMGGGGVDNGFVVPYSRRICAIRNTRQQGTGEDKDYRMQILSTASGCCAWGSVAPGNRVLFYMKPEGMFAADLHREVLFSDDIFLHAPVAAGDFTYEIPQSVAATAADSDGAYIHAAVMRSALWIAYRSASAPTRPDRMVCYDWSSDRDMSGLEALFRGAEPYGWSLPLVRAFTALAEGRRTDGSHLYGWNDANGGSTGDGRIDEFETSDTDNGTAIAAEADLAYCKVDGANVAMQEAILEHDAPVGSTGSLVVHRSYQDATSTLTPSTSNTLPVIREVKMFPQAARVLTAAGYLAYTQATGAARRLRRVMLKAKVLPLYK